MDQERGQRRKSKKIIENLRRRDIERQKQAQYEKIQRSRYNERYNDGRDTGICEQDGESQQLIAQARCRNIKRWNGYWEKEERRNCDICEGAPGTMKHLTRECRKVDRKIGIEEVLSGRKDEKVEKWLRMVKEK